MASEREVRTVERINLRNIINQWNANRLDLFELSEPNEVSAGGRTPSADARRETSSGSTH